MGARARDVRKAIEAMGGRLETPSRGSHYKCYPTAEGGRCYPLTLHNGERTEVPDDYVKKLCKAFEWDLAAFKAHL